MNIIDPFKLPSLPLAWNRALPKCPAIYFAISENKQILYIGSTVNLNRRWFRHKRCRELGNVGNVQIAWFQVSDISILIKLESQSIRYYQPSLNIRRCKGDGTGRIQIRTITKKNGKQYQQAWYDWQLKSGEKTISKSTYIPKRLLSQVQMLEAQKAPIKAILQLLGTNL
jgi:hypothetical protein